jgi:hypothetical protein
MEAAVRFMNFLKEFDNGGSVYITKNALTPELAQLIGMTGRSCTFMGVYIEIRPDFGVVETKQ